MTDDFIKENCKDRYDYPFEIPDTYGENIAGVKHKTTQCERPRTVTLLIDSFIGYDYEAVHVYGRFRAYGPRVVEIDGDPDYSCSGFLPEETDEFKKEIEKTKFIDIQLTRPVTDEEYEKDPERFCWGTTNAWNTTEELIDFAKTVFERRFKGNWKLEIKRID